MDLLPNSKQFVYFSRGFYDLNGIIVDMRNELNLHIFPAQTKSHMKTAMPVVMLYHLVPFFYMFYSLSLSLSPQTVDSPLANDMSIAKQLPVFFNIQNQ